MTPSLPSPFKGGGLGWGLRSQKMHYFPLRDIQHFIMYFFPAFLTVFLIGMGLAFTHFRTKRSEENKDKVFYEYNEGIQDKNGFFVQRPL